MSRNPGKWLADTEFRYWPTGVEATGDGETRSVGGVFAPYWKRSRLLPGGFYEVISNSALRKSLQDGLDIVSRLEHDPRYLLGTTESQTLEIADNPNVGASYRVILPKTMAGRDAWELVRSGRLNHSSMGFMCPPGGDEFKREGSAVVRHLISVRLTEASPVSQPGYIETSTAVRHLASQVDADPADVAALAAAGELRTLLMRTDQAVMATPGIEPGSLVETRNTDGTPADPALEAARTKNRHRGLEQSREGRLALTRLREKNKTRGETYELERLMRKHQANEFAAAPKMRSLDGRDYYSRTTLLD